MLGFALIVELFADARADLAGHFGRIDGGLHAAVDGEQPFELLEVGLHSRLHVRILQLAGQRRTVQRGRPMHLAERGGRRRPVLEARELPLPVRAELRHHAPLDEGPAHRRGVALQLGEFLGVFRRQRVGNGRHQLGDLHDRAFETAERGSKLHRAAGAIVFAAHQPGRGNAGGDPADIGADPRIAGGAGREPVPFEIGQREPPNGRAPRFRCSPRGRRRNPDLFACSRLLSSPARALILSMIFARKVCNFSGSCSKQSIGKSRELKGRVRPSANCPGSSARGCPRSPRRRRGRGSWPRHPPPAR